MDIVSLLIAVFVFVLLYILFTLLVRLLPIEVQGTALLVVEIVLVLVALLWLLSLIGIGPGVQLR